jgi:hypothetical protein
MAKLGKKIKIIIRTSETILRVTSSIGNIVLSKSIKVISAIEIKILTAVALTIKAVVPQETIN